MKKYCAYAVLGVGYYLCTCITLFLLNIIGIGNFDHIFIDGFSVALLGGAILLLAKWFAKRKSKG